MAASIGDKVLKMNNGKSIPVLGLGTWQSKPEEVKGAVRAALECGYRHIDTAIAYGNEAEIGEVLHEFLQAKKIKREEVFITTKLPGTFMSPEHVEPAIQSSLKKLKLDYVDLFLIHSPAGMKFMGLDKVWPFGPDGKLQFEKKDLVACWKAMEKMVDRGLTKSIGISNFNSEQVDRIIKNSRIKPVTNQVECHAYFAQNELAAFLKERSIFITAYAPIASPGRPAEMTKGETAVPLLQNKVITDLAAKYKKSPAQICLRNLLQRGFVVIPKSTNPKRIKENSQIFDFTLTDADMTAIAGLNNGVRLFNVSSWGDPEKIPENPFQIPF